LTQVLGFSRRHTGWAPDLLTDEVKAERVTTAAEMLRIQKEQEVIDFAGIIADDESWFFLDYSRDHVWSLGDENLPERVSQKRNTEKHILTMFCSTSCPQIEECDTCEIILLISSRMNE
jgi:hypothetical protein